MDRRESLLIARLEARYQSILENAKTRHPFVEVVASHLIEDMKLKGQSPTARIRLNAILIKRADRVARTVVWMQRPGVVVGQQAMQSAEKALRLLVLGRGVFSDLENLATEFRRSKYTFERRTSESKSRAKQCQVPLADNWTARRITTERELMEQGQKFGNCLASGRYSRVHRRRLREVEAQYWVIYDNQGSPKCIISIDDETKQVSEVKGLYNEPPYGCCDAIVDFIAKRELLIGYDDELNDLGISDDLIKAAKNHTLETMRIKINGVNWTLRVAPGMMVGEAGAVTFTVRGSPADETDYVRMSGISGYKEVAGLRCGLRKACKEDVALAGAVMAAFSTAEPVVVQDWFDL